MRRRIHEMKSRGLSDDQVVNTFVREEGIVALASPPVEGWGLITWIVPPIVLLTGFFVYSLYVRRNRQPPQVLSQADAAVMDRFRAQIERDLEEYPTKDGAERPK